HGQEIDGSGGLHGIGASSKLARLALELVAQLLLLILDEPADHLSPKRFDEIGRHALLLGPGAPLVDHLLVAPGHARFLARLELELPRTLDVAEALGDQVDEGVVDTVDLDTDLGEVGALGGRADGHGSLSLAGCGRLAFSGLTKG